MFVPTQILGFLGISASSIVDDLLNTVTNWLEIGSASIITGAGGALDETTSVAFGSAFVDLYGSMRMIGGAFALPFFFAATIQALVRHDTGSLARTLIVRAPVALLGSGIAIWMIQEGLAVTDALSDALLASQNASGTHFTTGLVGLLIGSKSVLSGFEGVALAGVTAAGAFFLWIELVIRSAAVLCASLFIPLALAGVIWPVTGHWIKRLAETLAALVLAKLAMVAVLVLGVDSLGDMSGVSGVIEGAAILILSAAAPFALLRMLPFIEQGAVSHFEGVGRHATQSALNMVNADRLRHPLGGGDGDLAPRRDPIPLMSSQPVDAAAFHRHFNDIRGEIAERNRGEGSDRP